MATLKDYAIEELTRIRMYGSSDEYNQMMTNHILKMIDVFSEEGHSGLSAAYAISILSKLLNYKPLTPLTGEESEWNKLDDGGYQNKRCFSVFKTSKNGKAYNISGRVFVGKDDVSFTSRASRVFIRFPYTPKTEYTNEKWHWYYKFIDKIFSKGYKILYGE